MTAQEILERKGVKSTSNRILVLNTLLKHHNPVSLMNMETEIETLDKSSISRVLNILLSNNIIHSIDDGSGSQKYELCHGDHDHSVDDLHIHFHCMHCQSTFCFESMPIPKVSLPEGFTSTSINYVVKGICPDCQRFIKN